jgi:ribonuclease P protein component
VLRGPALTASKGPSPATARKDTNLFQNCRGTVTASVPGESNQAVEQSRPKANFPRSVRLLRHSDFQRVYKQGRRHFSPSMTVFYLRRSEAPVAGQNAAKGLRVGFTVGRVLGGAVQRNRMKRRLREAVRLTMPASAPGADVVINPKKSLLTAEFDSVVNEVRQAFVVIGKKLGSTK